MPVRKGINLSNFRLSERAASYWEMERVTGIEPVRSAWEADRLPLHHTRNGGALSWQKHDVLADKAMPISISFAALNEKNIPMLKAK